MTSKIKYIIMFHQKAAGFLAKEVKNSGSPPKLFFLCTLKILISKLPSNYETKILSNINGNIMNIFPKQFR